MALRIRNYPLLIGGALAGLLVLIAIFGPALAPHNPLVVFRSINVDGTPYGPPPLRALGPFISASHPLGMDRISRDMTSRLLWAVRPTLILCAIAAATRLAIGVLVGLVAGWWGRRSAWLIDTLTSASSAIPLILVAIAAIAISPFSALLTFVFALSLTGWVNTAAIVQTRIQAVLQTPYVESARAIGQHKLGIFWRHVLPQIWPLLPLILATELSAVTLVVAELGYLGFFIGGAFVYVDHATDSPIPTTIIPAAHSPELSQMLSDFFGQSTRTPWVPIWAGIVVVIMLCAFTLLSEGLRRELDVTRSRSVGWRRRLVGWLGRRRQAPTP